jgi:CDP-glucose 4,6-dehydratase
MSFPKDLGAAYRGRRVLLTGHTGFKGSWMLVWLAELGAEVTGFALPPESDPSLFQELSLERACRHVVGDVRDLSRLVDVLREQRPDWIFHFAAQSLVRRGYRQPVETVAINVLGTANLLEAVRRNSRPCTLVIVTSDKCYENRNQQAGYREEDPMGGHDPYAASKGAAELVTAAYRRSFFPEGQISEHGVGLASARAGNALGGGDWAPDRLLPDAIRALERGGPVAVRNPDSVRPWQHVLEPLSGYLLLGHRLGIGTDAERATFCGPWNFGPADDNARPVREVIDRLLRQWGSGAWTLSSEERPPHEAARLTLAIDKARDRLGWSPRWGLEETIRQTVAWYRARRDGASPAALRSIMARQISDYLAADAV